MQVYHLGLILVRVNSPPSSDLQEFRQRERLIEESVDVICGIALNICADYGCMMSGATTFFAGLHTKDQEKRNAILEILGRYKDFTGHPLGDFRDELHTHWANNG